MEGPDLSSTNVKTVGDDVDLGSASAGLQSKGMILSSMDVSEKLVHGCHGEHLETD